MNKNLFDNIEINKFKWLFVWKYCFQLLIEPAIFSCAFSIFAFFSSTIIRGWDKTINEITEYIKFGFLYGRAWLVISIAISLFLILPNILSIIPFIGLLWDTTKKNNSITKDIDFTKWLPPYELQCIRQSKRFMCDTFSKKKNLELFIYDEHNKKYRFFWNESFSTMPLSQVKDDLNKASRLRISYFKHSKIIFKCEVIQYKSIYTHTKA